MILMTNYHITKSALSIDFRELMQAKTYERIILALMNASKTVFPGEYIHNDFQSNGECDFEEMTTHEKFDAKFLLSQEQGAKIGSRNGDITKFTTELYAEAAEFSQCFSKNANMNVNDLGIYKIMEKLLKKTKADENIIFFVPYPIVFDFQSFPLIGANDVLKAVYTELTANCPCDNNGVYAIYIAFDNKVVLRNMRTDCREYLCCPELERYAHYDISPIENTK